VLGPGVLLFVEWDGFSLVLHSSTGWIRKRSDPSGLGQRDAIPPQSCQQTATAE
jgi:hypothetical protein